MAAALTSSPTLYAGVHSPSYSPVLSPVTCLALPLDNQRRLRLAVAPQMPQRSGRASQMPSKLRSQIVMRRVLQMAAQRGAMMTMG